MTATVSTEPELAPTVREEEPPPTEEAARAEARASSRALSDLLAPARPSITTGVILQVFGSIATIAPYVAIAELGKTFLVDGEGDRARVWWISAAVVVALLARTLLSGAALSVTHFADARLQGIIRPA
ncbi:hypothetical protein Psuf_061270 [Phytohabitans suffuscus]|uniref:Uncharacterized protein n=1 Tax=Phytohabitans suffuscus TaxID=624315 RepID=A0A6F8YRT5_9ACTN|nr:hypothetical protein [Phytohabitans suffuscus]BCB88814.1 hypothetical protein Psuf_061270 [Phytohabitans suffuscus]